MKPTKICSRIILTLLFASFGIGQTQSGPGVTLTARGDIIRRRMEWFYRQRAYPLKRTPPGARLRALKEMDRILAGEGRTLSGAPSEPSLEVSSSLISSTRWTFIGPEPTDTYYNVPVVSGRVTALAVDPTNDNIVYAGAADGGIWKTTDGGTSWRSLTDMQPSLAIGSIAIDPFNHSTVYVGTGEENFSGDSYFGAGILKSTNGGASWTQIQGPFVAGQAYIGSIAIQPGNSSVILVAVEMNSDKTNPDLTDVYRTDDGGQTWSSVLHDSTEAFKAGTAVLFDPSNGNIAYAAVSGPFNSCSGCISGVYKSLDGGKTWARINGTGSNVLPTTNLGRIALAIAPSSPNTLYAGIQDTSTFGILGFFKTTDGGTNWVKLVNTPDYCDQQCWYDQAIVVAPNNPNVVFVGGNGSATVYRSTDGGVNWANVTQGADGFSLHADLHALAFSTDSKVLYVGNDGGVWKTSGPTTTPVPWTELNDTLAITQFYFSPSISSDDVTNSFGGTQDNGTQKYGGKVAWSEVVCGDGGWTAIDPGNSSNVYSTCPGENGLVWKSGAGGAFGSWSLATNGINIHDTMEFLPPLALDSLHPASLYFGTNRVYQTTNQAGNWTPISNDLTSGHTITSIAVSPTDSNTVYVGTSNPLMPVQVTTNALAGTGAVWSPRGTGLPRAFVTQVAVDPHISTTAYVCLSGFNNGHVFRTTDGGVTWSNISNNLPNVPVNAIVIDPVLPNTLYVATDIGVFRTTGAKWSVLGAGLPRAVALGLTLHNSSRTLRAATHGRSMWDIHLPIADLFTTLTESPSPVLHGTNLKYTVKVTNQGPDMAMNTVVSDATPAGTSFVSFSTSAGTCTAPAVGATGTLKCNLETVAVGTTATITMTVNDSAAAGSTLVDTARASSNTPDSNTKNNAVTVKTNVD